MKVLFEGLLSVWFTVMLVVSSSENCSGDLGRANPAKGLCGGLLLATF